MNIENQVVLGLGGNMGNRTQYLALAMVQIIQQIGPITKMSSVYETAAWGNKDQHAFLNIAICISTPFTPLQTLERCLRIEKQMGRHKTIKWEPRIIDIDILLYNNQIIKDKNLFVPHPMMHERRFVLEPLAEILPKKEHPILKKTFKELLQSCTDLLTVKPFFNPFDHNQ
jgi:2-amino-4-hydroxy-6-hydroxymethyldihydropteridine diphosphokinase